VTPVPYGYSAGVLWMAMALAGPALAQTAGGYPSKPIRVVVPSAPGGGTDIVARLIAQGLNESWGQPVVVDNRGGAGGTAGVSMVAKGTAADGYTLLLGSAGHLTFGPALYSRLPYDPQKDLAPVSLVASQPFVLAAEKSLPADSVKELIALAKSRPDAIRYGSGGSGSASHLGIVLLEHTAGISMLHVPYKGSNPSVAALMGGEIQVALAGIETALPQVRSGRIKALAVTGAKRSRSAPELPTVAEAGVPGYAFEVWYGMVVPAGTPRAVVAKISAEIVRLLKSPVVAQRFSAAGLEPLGSTPEEFSALIAREIPRWREVVKAANIRVE
jgi:tripartite-type tricarboxylate transporter receptor subunit TctC